MYAPCPPRPKKTSIVRTRTGCSMCRTKRRKCDEGKPKCNRCVRQGVSCDYSQPFTFLDTTSVTKRRAERDQSKKSASFQGRALKEDLSEFTSNTIVLARSDSSGSSHEYAASPDKSDGPETPYQTAWSPTASFQIKPEIHSPVSSSSDDTTRPWISNSYRETGVAITSNFQNESSISISRFNFLSGLPFTNISDRKYLAHFNNFVSNQLPPEFQSSKSMAMECIMLRTTILALSASNLSLLEANKREVSQGGVRKKQFIRQADHRQQGLNYYDLAIKHYSNGPLTETASSKARLASSILMAHFEYESGSPKGFFAHVRGADALVLAKHTEIAQSANGRDFLSCWAALHARHDLLILPFRTLNLEREHMSKSPDDSKLLSLIHEYGNGNAKLLKALADAWRVTQRIHLVRCMRVEGDDSTSALRRSLKWYSKHWDFPFSFDMDLDDEEHGKFAEDEDLMRFMASLKSELNMWHDKLPLESLPLESGTSISLDADPNQHPLKFRSPSAARDYILYALTQLMTSEDVLSLSSDNPDETMMGPTMHPWSHIVLRCIAGLDFSSFEVSPYSVNIIHMLRCISESPPNTASLKAILDGPVARLGKESMVEPLRMDLALINRTFRFKYEQVSKGKAILLLHVWNPLASESTSRDFAREIWAAVHGRCARGPLFSEFVQIP